MSVRRFLPVLAAVLLVAACGPSASDEVAGEADANGNAAAAGGPCADVEEGRLFLVPAVPGGEAIRIVDGGAAIAAKPWTLCEDAVALATQRLGWLHWPITSTRFRTSMCGPAMRCAANLGNRGWVIFTFAGADPVMIHVGPPETGEPVLVAGDPEPIPAWLLEEIQQGAS